jgi:hypothetical protein
MNFTAPDPDSSHLGRQVETLRERLRGADPAVLAGRTGASYRVVSESEGEFTLPVWGEMVRLAFPGFDARPASGAKPVSLGTKALLMYYFATADGASLAGRWIAFSELPSGRFYQQAFQGYSGAELARAFGNDLDAFARAALHLGGRPQPLGDAAFSFQVLPFVPLLAAAWAGDEDLPASYQVLFDASAHHYLPTDVGAIQGGTLARRLVAAKTAL